MKITYLGPLIAATEEECEAFRREEENRGLHAARISEQIVKMEKEFMSGKNLLRGKYLLQRLPALKQQVETLGEARAAFSGFSFPCPSKKLASSVFNIYGDFDPDANEPIAVGMSVWVFRRKCFQVENEDYVPLEEIASRIKHAAYKEEKALAKIQKEVAAFENFERLPSARRERIPESVRLFVWQRDGGRCVKCESTQRLEFDHLIPVAEGGSSTERNIQLLCEKCNRSKGKTV